jgi:hypothetical protein
LLAQGGYYARLFARHQRGALRESGFGALGKRLDPLPPTQPASSGRVPRARRNTAPR